MPVGKINPELFAAALAGIPDELATTMTDKQEAWNASCYVFAAMLKGLGEQAPNRVTYIFGYDGDTDGPYEVTISRVRGTSLLEQLEMTERALEAERRLRLATLRLLDGLYAPWESSGGPEECKHGIWKEIPCRQCDKALVHPIGPSGGTVTVPRG